MSRSENSGMFDYHFLPRQAIYERTFKGKQWDLKCSYYHNTGHLIDRCWQLYPEIKPWFTKEQWGYQRWSFNYKSNHSTKKFTANPVVLIQEFANYLQDKHNYEKVQNGAAGQE
jgi:hypothetical protein